MMVDVSKYHWYIRGVSNTEAKGTLNLEPGSGRVKNNPDSTRHGLSARPAFRVSGDQGGLDLSLVSEVAYNVTFYASVMGAHKELGKEFRNMIDDTLSGKVLIFAFPNKLPPQTENVEAFGSDWRTSSLLPEDPRTDSQHLFGVLDANCHTWRSSVPQPQKILPRNFFRFDPGPLAKKEGMKIPLKFHAKYLPQAMEQLHRRLNWLK